MCTTTTRHHTVSVAPHYRSFVTARCAYRPFVSSWRWDGTGARRYLISGLWYNRYCVLSSATRAYYLVRLRIPAFSSHTTQIRLSFLQKDHEIYLRILVFCDVTARSRRFEKTRCPSSIFPARVHIRVTIKIQVVRDVTPGRWWGGWGFEETCCILVQSFGSPWRWKY